MCDHIWTIGELVDTALQGLLPERMPEPPCGSAPCRSTEDAGNRAVRRAHSEASCSLAETCVLRASDGSGALRLHGGARSV
jgi:hypothetical protein